VDGTLPSNIGTKHQMKKLLEFNGELSVRETRHLVEVLQSKRHLVWTFNVSEILSTLIFRSGSKATWAFLDYLPNLKLILEHMEECGIVSREPEPTSDSSSESKKRSREEDIAVQRSSKRPRMMNEKEGKKV